MRTTKGLASVLLCALTALAFSQQPLTPQQALARLFQPGPVKSEWFAPAFLNQIPLQQVDSIVQQCTATLGNFVRVDAAADGVTLVMDHGTVPVKIHLDAQQRIDGLGFGLPQPAKPANVTDVIKEFSALSGKVSAAVTEDDKLLASLHPDDALAVGSAFKLAILAAAQEQTAAGKHRLDEVHLLDQSWKSLPSGVLQSWPVGTPLTLATLENEMISVSDNTAADAMLSIVGREEVEKFAPRNRPFLSTRETFALKAQGNEALLDRYREADEAHRRAMLGEIDAQPVPSAAQFGEAPVAPDVEWFFTGAELCGLIEKTASTEAMRINPGLAKPTDWSQIAFKGGSEGGVLNLTTALTGKNGKHYCVTATWNDTKPVDQNRFFTIYQELLASLAAAAQ
ncbi:MAG: serine hydrolase [Terracidiphilus sp.]|nr:serine hydrolase [Terracidiphilus sp.]MDR3796957.1 serine hydrolase [Terracidiphilus sp.]